MPPPILDVMADAKAVPFRRAAFAVLTAAVVSLCLGSQALQTWSTALPINRASDAVLTMAAKWNEAMVRAGLTAVAAELRAEFRKFEGWEREGN